MPFAAAIPVILAATAVAGVGLQAYGSIQSAHAAAENRTASQNIAADQQRQEALRQQQMELDNQRRQREAIRVQQRARSTALTAATSQGAQFGSGLSGGYGQISGQSNENMLGLSQSLALGRANFGLSSDISQNRISQANAGYDASMGSGLSSLGGGLVSSLGSIGRLSGGFYPGSSSYNQSSPTYFGTGEDWNR